MASGNHGHAFLLTDGQLDKTTAGAPGNLSLALAAFAEGPTATTSAEGSIRTGQTSILLVEITPQAPSSYRAKLVGVAPADLVFASGSASATGDISANCSAQAKLDGQVAFFSQTTSMAVTPSSATCSCGAFALSIPSLVFR